MRQGHLSLLSVRPFTHPSSVGLHQIVPVVKSKACGHQKPTRQLRKRGSGVGHKRKKKGTEQNILHDHEFKSDLKLGEKHHLNKCNIKAEIELP